MYNSVNEFKQLAKRYNNPGAYKGTIFHYPYTCANFSVEEKEISCLLCAFLAGHDDSKVFHSIMSFRKKYKLFTRNSLYKFVKNGGWKEIDPQGDSLFNGVSNQEVKGLFEWAALIYSQESIIGKFFTDSNPIYSMCGVLENIFFPDSGIEFKNVFDRVNLFLMLIKMPFINLDCGFYKKITLSTLIIPCLNENFIEYGKQYAGILGKRAPSDALELTNVFEGEGISPVETYFALYGYDVEQERGKAIDKLIAQLDNKTGFDCMKLDHFTENDLTIDINTAKIIEILGSDIFYSAVKSEIDNLISLRKTKKRLHYLNGINTDENTFDKMLAKGDLNPKDVILNYLVIVNKWKSLLSKEEYDIINAIGKVAYNNTIRKFMSLSKETN